MCLKIELGVGLHLLSLPLYTTYSQVVWSLAGADINEQALWKTSNFTGLFFFHASLIYFSVFLFSKL